MLVKDQIITEIDNLRESLGFATKKNFSYTKSGNKITPLPIGNATHLNKYFLI